MNLLGFFARFEIQIYRSHNILNRGAQRVKLVNLKKKNRACQRSRLSCFFVIMLMDYE